MDSTSSSSTAPQESPQGAQRMADFALHPAGSPGTALVDSVVVDVRLAAPGISAGCDYHRRAACAVSLKAACCELVHDSSITPTSPTPFLVRAPPAAWPPLCHPCLAPASRSSPTLSSSPFDLVTASAGSSFSQLPVVGRPFASLQPSLLVWPSPESLDGHCSAIAADFASFPCFARLTRPTCVFVDLELPRGCRVNQ